MWHAFFFLIFFSIHSTFISYNFFFIFYYVFSFQWITVTALMGHVSLCEKKNKIKWLILNVSILSRILVDCDFFSVVLIASFFIRSKFTSKRQNTVNEATENIFRLLSHGYKKIISVSKRDKKPEDKRMQKENKKYKTTKEEGKKKRQAKLRWTDQ